MSYPTALDLMLCLGHNSYVLYRVSGSHLMVPFCGQISVGSEALYSTTIASHTCHATLRMTLIQTRMRRAMYGETVRFTYEARHYGGPTPLFRLVHYRNCNKKSAGRILT